MFRRLWTRMRARYRIAGLVLRDQRDADVWLCLVWALMFGGALAWSSSSLGPVAVVAAGVLGTWLFGGELLLLRARPKGQVLLHALDGIETARLRLRRLCRDDVEAVLSTMDDEVLKSEGMVERLGPRTWARYLRFPDRRKVVAWAVVTDRRSGEVLGGLACLPMPARPLAWHVGFWLGPSGRNQGYEPEILRAAVSALHTVGAVPDVYFARREDQLEEQQVARDVGAVEISRPPLTLPDGSQATIWYVHRG